MKTLEVNGIRCPDCGSKMSVLWIRTIAGCIVRQRKCPKCKKKLKTTESGE